MARMARVMATCRPNSGWLPEKSMPKGPESTTNAMPANTVAMPVVRSAVDSELRTPEMSLRAAAWAMAVNITVAMDKAMIECGMMYSSVARLNTNMPGIPDFGAA